MADPLVLLLPAPDRDAGPLRDRLVSMGFRCELAGNPPSPPSSGPAVILIQGAAGGLPGGLRETRISGSPLERIPVLFLAAPEGEHAGPPAGVLDEILPAGASDEMLAGRLRTWGRWSLLARAGSGSEAAAGREHPASILPGHKAFMETLGTEMKRQDRYDAPLGLVLADIDGLREINERYGHRTGDLVIREMALLLKEAVRGSDMVFHFGGDAFAILLTHSTAEATARAVSRLRSVVAGRIIRGQAEGGGPQPLLKVSMTFGHATLPDAGVKEPGALVSMAERSLASMRQGGPGSAVTPGSS